MKPFLTAEWQRLILLTYEVDSYLLEEYLPEGLELDTYKGRTFASFVAFDFFNTRVRGMAIPFHINFPEINLRFYVKQPKADGSYRRGVVFVKELVPKPCVAMVARRLYNEPYEAISMESSWEESEGGNQLVIEHSFEYRRVPQFMRFVVENKPYFPKDNSTEHFFKEHEWGFGVNRQQQLTAYRVNHPVWRVYPLKTRFELKVRFDLLYGEAWSFLNGKLPYNVLVAEGSGVEVFPESEVF